MNMTATCDPSPAPDVPRLPVPKFLSDLSDMTANGAYLARSQAPPGRQFTWAVTQPTPSSWHSTGSGAPSVSCPQPLLGAACTICCHRHKTSFRTINPRQRTIGHFYHLFVKNRVKSRKSIFLI